MRRSFFVPLAAGIAVAALAGCSTYLVDPTTGPAAKADLQPTQGSNVRGTVTFTRLGEDVKVAGEVTGLKPNAEHGFHIHEKGDCSSGDGMSAGGHFNPTSRPHGGHDPRADRHAGDMPNLKADASGTAKFSFVLTGLTIGRENTDIVGRGLIVHRDPDDYRSQPAGNAGPRLACAVIQKQ